MSPGLEARSDELHSGDRRRGQRMASDLDDTDADDNNDASHGHECTPAIELHLIRVVVRHLLSPLGLWLVCQSHLHCRCY